MKTENFPPNISNKARMSALSISIQLDSLLFTSHSTRTSSQSMRQEKKKGIQIGKKDVKLSLRGTSLVGQWLRLQAPNAWGPGSIPG